MLVEILIMRMAKTMNIKAPPPIVGMVLTQGLLLLVADYLFFPPVETLTDIADQVASGVVANFSEASAAVSGLFANARG